MRLVYFDEAGISANEPYTVVVGIMVDADKSWLATANSLDRLFEKVPEPYRDGFHFHATDIYNNHDYREAWSEADRVDFMCDVMKLGRSHGNALVWAAVSASTLLAPPIVHAPGSLSKEKIRHGFTFAACVLMADLYMRECAGEGEIAAAVAEDVGDMRRHLRSVTAQFRNYRHPQAVPVPDNPDARFRTLLEGTIVPTVVTRIADSVHFASKGSAPILQIADACAYGIRRSLEGRKDGSRFAAAIGGEDADFSPIQVGLDGNMLLGFGGITLPDRS